MLERSSPIRLFVTLLVLLFCTEAAVMVALEYLFPKGASFWVEASIDASLLTAIASIFVWRIFMRPLKFAYTDEATRAKAVMDGAAEGIITFDERGTIESFNRAAEGMFGYKANETVGKNVRILMPEAHISEHHGNIARHIRPGKDGSIGRPRELLALRKDATEFPIELTVTEIRLGDTRRFTGIIRDITERRRAEEVRADLAAIVENSNDAIITRTLDGTITSWNAGAEKIFGYAAAEMVGRNISIIAPAERQHEAEHNAWLLQQGITVPPFETVRVTKDGRQIHVQMSVSAIRDAAGNVTRIAAILRDVTERIVSTRRRAMEHAVTRALAESETLDEAMPKLIRTVCAAMDWAYGARWAWNEAEQRLCRAEYWSAFDADFDPADRDYWLRLGSGGPGGLLRRAWLTKELTWRANLHEDETFRRKPSCVKFGLHSAYCFPILVGNTVIGAMEFFGRDVRPPDDTLLQITYSIGSQLGQFIQRKQAEEAHAQLAAIVQSSNDAIISRSIDGIITSWNAGAERIFGYSSEEAIGQLANFNLPPGREPNMARNNEKLLRGEVIAPHESKRVTKDGRVIDVLTSHSPIKDGAGNIVGASVILQDISALKQAEAALSESEERFGAAFEQAGVGMALRSIDPRNSRFLRVNQKLCDILGYTQDELLQLTSLDITLPEEREAAIVNYNEKLASGEFTSYSREKRYLRKDRSIIWTNISLAAVRGPDGRPSHVIAVIADISERKRAEAERAQLAAIVENSNDAIVSRTLDGRIVSWNAGAERMLGYTAAEAIGQPISMIVPSGRESMTARYNERLLRGETVTSDETQRVAKDGRIIDVSRALSPIRDANGALVGAAMIMRDISERKRAERAAHRQNELTQVLEALARTANEAGTPAEAMQRCLEHICNYGKWPLGCVGTFAAGQSGGIPRATKWQTADPARFAELIRVSDGTDHTATRGHFVGRVLREKRPVWLADLSQLGAPGRMGRAVQLGLRSAFAFPVIVGEEVAAFLEFFAHEPREPDRVFLDAIGTVGAQLARLIERERALDEARASEQKLSGILGALHEVVWSMDARSGRLLYLNAAAKRLTRRPVNDFLANRRLWRRMIHPEDRAAVRSGARTLLEHGELTHEFRIVLADGEVRVVENRARVVRDARGAPQRIDGTLNDITERKQAEERSDYLAQYDVLTELPNRRLFKDRLTLATARDRRLGTMTALLLLDLDRFKQVNETLGHSAGDKVLQAVTARLRDQLRDVDTIARLSGDEFAVILESVTEKAQALHVAEKIMEAMAEPFALDGEEIFVTASVGATVFPVDADNVERLIECAELAMHQAKQEGRNTAQLYATRQSPRRGAGLSMETRLRRALERDELLLNFQPKVDINTGAITGAEALVRWRNPDLGLVSPADFIPLAEETGLILPIGEWVLHSACTQASVWRRQGHPIAMAVNLSARQFRQKNLCEMVSLTLDDSGLHPGYLELEITESMIMHHPEQAIATLQQLRDIGVMLSVDDFGTGYSSLSYLKRFPVHKLKVDQSFVRELHQNADDSAIVRAVIALAKNLNLKTVAEGVETEQQLIFLAGLQCDEYQGYYFSKPLPAAEFLSLLQAKRSPALGAGPSVGALKPRAPDHMKIT